MSPPPHVRDALVGRRVDFVVPVPRASGPSPALRIGLAVVALVFGLTVVLLLTLSENVNVSGPDDGEPRPATVQDRILFAGVAGLMLSAIAAFFLFTGLRARAERDGWLAGTDEGILVVTAKGARLEPWSGFSEARLAGDLVHLVARPGLRDPGGRHVPAGDDPQRMRDLLDARIKGLPPGEGLAGRLGL